jgi:hypothetical protein
MGSTKEFEYLARKFQLMNDVLLETLDLSPGYLSWVGLPDSSQLDSATARVQVFHVLAGIECRRSGLKSEITKVIPPNNKIVHRIEAILDEIDSRDGGIAFYEALAWAMEIRRMLNLPEAERQEPDAEKPEGEPEESEEGEEGEGKSGSGNPSDGDGGESQPGSGGESPENGENGESGESQEGESMDAMPGAGNPSETEKGDSGMMPTEYDHHQAKSDGKEEPGDIRKMARMNLTDELNEFAADLAKAKLDPSVLRTGGICEATSALIDMGLVTKLTSQLNQIVKGLKSKRETIDYDGYGIDGDALHGLKINKSDTIQSKIYQTTQKDEKNFEIVFCVDRSGSMRMASDGINDRQYLANKTVANISRACENAKIATQIIYFTDTAWMEKAKDQKTISCEMGKEKACGENDIAMAAKLAVKQLDGSKADRRAVVILTDGGDSTYRETGDIIRKNPGVEFYFVWVESDDQFIKKMEQWTHQKPTGSVVVGNAADVPNASMRLVKTFLARTKNH